MNTKTEKAKCAFCTHEFTRQVRKHPRLYCSTRCERFHNVKPVKPTLLLDRYEDCEHIRLDYEGRLDDE